MHGDMPFAKYANLIRIAGMNKVRSVGKIRTVLKPTLTSASLLEWLQERANVHGRCVPKASSNPGSDSSLVLLSLPSILPALLCI